MESKNKDIYRPTVGFGKQEFRCFCDRHGRRRRPWQKELFWQMRIPSCACCAFCLPLCLWSLSW